MEHEVEHVRNEGLILGPICTTKMAHQSKFELLTISSYELPILRGKYPGYSVT